MAAQRGRVQLLLVRVRSDGDFFHPAQEGGVALSNLGGVVRGISKVRGVRIEGITSFPCFVFDYKSGETVPTPNLETVLRAADTIRDVLGKTVTQINAPGMTACGTMNLLAAAGVTHGEPGSSLIGHTPLHAFSEQPERPAMVYVSEVSHRLGNCNFAFGGGFYPRGRAKAAIVARSAHEIFSRPALPVQPRDAQNIDYYGELQGTGEGDCRVGDTVVYAFRSQVFVSRSYVAVITGARFGKVRLLALFDHMGNPLDSRSRLQLGHDEASDILDKAWAEAAPRDSDVVHQ